MNRVVELVNTWAAFEQEYPAGSIEDFCRHYLVSNREKHNKDVVKAAIVDGQLLRMMGRITKMTMTYAQLALEGTELIQMEEYGFLLAIQNLVNPEKSAAILANLMPISSGTDMLKRMIKRGLVSETVHEEDKRSKRLMLTPKGKAAVATGGKRIGKLAKMMLHAMPEDDKHLCIQLLKVVEEDFSALWLQQKIKDFDTLYELVMEKDK